MNALSQTTTVLRPRPGSDPVFGQFGGPIRTMLRSLRMQWFLYRAGRRKTRASESVGEMNAHLLRDIGASDEMVARATAPKAPYERSGVPFGLAVLTVALVLGVTSTPTSAGNIGATDANGQAQVQAAKIPMDGVFAGEYVNGAPVYRFPAVVVTGSRKDNPSGNLQPCRQTRIAPSKSPA
jgi:hypothetical protein